MKEIWIALIVLCIVLLSALLVVSMKYRELVRHSRDAEEEIRKAVTEGHEQGVIDQTEAQMITNIFEFSEKEARDIMTHRGDVRALDGALVLEEAVQYMLKERNSRFPVYEENIDHIIGILHVKDALRFREEHPEKRRLPLRELPVLRRPLVIAETKDVDALFRQMQSTKSQMAVVIDEYGQMAGLVTMEDIVEEIVGNILDEYDVDETHIHPAGSRGEYILDGRTPLEELEERFGMSFDKEKATTLNGFLTIAMDRVPEENDRFLLDYQGYRFRVLSVARQQVERVLLSKTAGA